MKHFLKAVAAVVITMVADIIVYVICNMNGIELNSVAMTIIVVFCGIQLYEWMIRKEK